MQKKIFWPLASLIVCAVLYFIWPVTHTMALRKLLLVLGAGIGIVLWGRSAEDRAILKSSWMITSGILLVWLVLHAMFLSQNGSEAWGELLGQWLPAYMAMLVGIGLGLAGSTISPSTFRTYLVAILAAQPVLYLFLSLFESIRLGHLAIAYWGIMDHKLGLTFYADLLAALSCAKFVDAANSDAGKIRTYGWVLPILLAFYVAIVSDSLNGILLLSVCMLLTLGSLAYQSRKNISRGIVAAAAILLIAVPLYAVSYSPGVQAKLKSLVSDTKAAVNIDKYPNWKNFAKLGLPTNEQGVRVRESFYLRVAYATAGLGGVLEHPWGYGISRHAFERLMQQKYPDVVIANSHNGYIDLVCAVGFPALLIVLLVIATAIGQARKSGSEWAHPTIWMIGITALHWALDPISRDHYLETFFFMVGLLSTLNLISHSENR